MGSQHISTNYSTTRNTHTLRPSCKLLLIQLSSDSQSTDSADTGLPEKASQGSLSMSGATKTPFENRKCEMIKKVFSKPGAHSQANRLSKADRNIVTGSWELRVTQHTLVTCKICCRIYLRAKIILNIADDLSPLWRECLLNASILDQAIKDIMCHGEVGARLFISAPNVGASLFAAFGICHVIFNISHLDILKHFAASCPMRLQFGRRWSEN